MAVVAPAANTTAAGLNAPAAKSFRLVLLVPWLGAAASPGTTEKLIVLAVVDAALAVNVYVMGAPSNTEAAFEVSV